MNPHKLQMLSPHKSDSTKPFYPSFYESDSPIQLDGLSGQRFSNIHSISENINENTINSNHFFEIHEFKTRNPSANLKDFDHFPENLETRESLDIGIERRKSFEDINNHEIRSIVVTNKMNSCHRYERENRTLNSSYTKLFLPKDKKVLGSLKPLRELTSPKRFDSFSRRGEESVNVTDLTKETIESQRETVESQRELPTSSRKSEEPIESIEEESRRISNIKGDFHDDDDLEDFGIENEDKEEEKLEQRRHSVFERKSEGEKEKDLSDEFKIRHSKSGVLRSVQRNTLKMEGISYNKPQSTPGPKKAKFQDPAVKNNNIYRTIDENLLLKSPMTYLQNKPDILRKSYKKNLIKHPLLLSKPPILLKEIATTTTTSSSVSARSAKKTPLSKENLSRYEKKKLTPNMNKFTLTKQHKNLEMYFQEIPITKLILEFLCVTSLTQFTRVCKSFRLPQYLKHTNILQFKLIIKGLNREEQFKFWNLRLDFAGLQKIYPSQFAVNATKKGHFERDIMSDVDRTRIFSNAVRQRLNTLTDILMALSNGVPKLGYVQGLNTMVALFLAQDLKDFEIYWLMKYLLVKKKLEELFVEGFPRVQLLNYQLEIYARNYLPDLIDHLDELGLKISYFTTQWFITMFTYDLEIPLLMKIFNLFFLKSWKIVIRVALAFLSQYKNDIMAKPADDLPYYLKSFLREKASQINDEELFAVAQTFKVNNRLLKSLEIIYEHSAPTDIALSVLPQDKPHWKIVAEYPSAKNPCYVYKDVMEYLNENIDHMKNLNKKKGFVSNELDNYRSVQQIHSGNSLIVDKSPTSRFKKSSTMRLNIPENLHNRENQQQDVSSTQENSFLQTISDLGKKLKQILTPKGNNNLLVRKFSDIKILHQPQETTENEIKEPLSERNHYNFALTDDKSKTKYDSVSNSFDLASTSKLRDVEKAYVINQQILDEILPANLLADTQPSNRESFAEQSNIITTHSVKMKNPFRSDKMAPLPPSKDKMKRKHSFANSTSDKSSLIAAAQKGHVTYTLQERDIKNKFPSNQLPQNDLFLSATLTLEESKEGKDYKKNVLSTKKGFSIPNKSYYFPEDSSGKKDLKKKNLIFSKKKSG